MPRRCILNVAVGAWYPRGQQRLLDSLKSVGYQGDVMTWTEEYPPGSPPHHQEPYAFKSYAFQAAQKAGYESLLWLDCSCWAIRPLEGLFEEIEQKGYLFSYEGWLVGSWIKDSALETLGLTRDEAMGIELLGGMCMGISLASETSRKWLEGFCQYCQDGQTITGRHRNTGNIHSQDPRCLGHGHDQPIASILARRFGMNLTYPPLWRDWARKDPQPGTVILACGM